MLDPHWQNLKEVFHAAEALTLKERRAYLDRACDGDAGLRRAVESLLRSHEETSFLDQPAYQAAAAMLLQHQNLSGGQSVGRYASFHSSAKAGWAKSTWLKIQSCTERSR